MSIFDTYKDVQSWPYKIFGGGGGGDPSKEANKYLDQIPDELRKYFDPYINRGNRMGDMLEGQYGDLMRDPGGRLNQIGGGYQQSPGFKFAMEQALGGAGRAASAGGMAGSPMHSQQNMELATNLANQDYNSWIKNALGLYGEGMGGAQDMYGIGAKAGMGLGEDLAGNMAQKARMAFEGQNYQNQRRGGIGGLLGAGAGMYLGGPAGAMGGSAIGRWLGGG